MKDYLIKLFLWIKSQNTFVKILASLIVLALCVMFFFSSCGLSRSMTKVKNEATGTTTTITQSSVGGTTSVTISPNTHISIDSTKIL